MNYKLTFEKWTGFQVNDDTLGTIRTTPENYYVATVHHDFSISFERIEACTRNISEKKVLKWWSQQKH